MLSSSFKTIGLIILISGSFYFFFNFFSGSDIANFSTYGGLIVALVGFLAMMLGNSKNVEAHNLAVSPQVTFTTHEQAVEMTRWFANSVKVVNIAPAPALGIVIRYKQDRLQPYTKWVTCFTLKGEETVELFWVRFPDTIQAAYHDRSEKRFFLTTYEDNQPKQQSISKQEYNKYAAAGIENRNNNNVHLRNNFIQFIEQQLQNNNNNIHVALESFNDFYNRYLM